MPINTTSTGASYGKSSDPLCPLGFHPQVRWPTRCKRCFRDYKEHSDSMDRNRFARMQEEQQQQGLRPGFSKSRSLDVTDSQQLQQQQQQQQQQRLVRQGSEDQQQQPSWVRSRSVQPEAAAGGNKTNVTVRGPSVEERLQRLIEEKAKAEGLMRNSGNRGGGAARKAGSAAPQPAAAPATTPLEFMMPVATTGNFQELSNKIKQLEKHCRELEKERSDLRGHVKMLEGELEEVQDNFREDEADEYRNLKRELELALKNCRVLQFKLKKAEKTLAETSFQKESLEKKVNGGNGGGAMTRRDSFKGGGGGDRSSFGRSGSFDSEHDRVLKDYQDAVERESDLREQLSRSEEAGEQMRITLSRLEDENESLSQQISKMSKLGKGRSSSAIDPGGGDGGGGDTALQLEVAEREASVLRKKVEGLLTENAQLKKSTEGGNSIGGSDANELSRLRREKNRLELSLSRAEEDARRERARAEAAEKANKSSGGSGGDPRSSSLKVENESLRREAQQKRQACQDLEQDLRRANDSLEQAQRDNSNLKRENDSLRTKNDANLQQTQQGIQTFKDEIDGLKKEAQREKSRYREIKDQLQDAKMKLSDKSTETERLESRVRDLEDKWAKSKRINQQRKEKVEALERQIQVEKQSSKSPLAKSRETKALEEKVSELERKLRQAESASSGSQRGKESDERETLQRELGTLRQTYNAKADEWIKEKLSMQGKVRELEESIRRSAGNQGWDVERERFKHILEDRDSQITQLKIEGDVARSQVSNLRKECEELKLKLFDYEKMSKFQRVMSTDSEMEGYKDEVMKLQTKVAELERGRKADINTLKLKYDAKIAHMSEDVGASKELARKLKKERDTYREMVEAKMARRRKKKDSSDSSSEEEESKAEDNVSADTVRRLRFKIQVLEGELCESRLESQRLRSETSSERMGHEIALAELRSRINQLEEEQLVDSGRAKIAGSRTKMELAWQKEREGQKKLIQELNTMAKDLKATLMEVERDREKQKLETNRRIEANTASYEQEHDDAKKQVSDLQYDLLELRDAHAKLRATNEKFRRDRDLWNRDREDLQQMALERSRFEQDEEKKFSRFLSSLDEFFAASDAVADRYHSASGLRAKAQLLRESGKEIEQMRQAVQQERVSKKEQLQTYISSGGARGLRSRNASRERTPAERQSSFRMSEWRSVDQAGSNAASRESLASNASIPLPIPVRTHSQSLNRHGQLPFGSESGYSSDTLNIRRLERDPTSMDRMSTGSRESLRSTQSEWVSGQRSGHHHKKSGLIGKLKKLTRGLSAERANNGDSCSDSASASGSASHHGGSSRSATAASTSRRPASSSSSGHSRPSRRDLTPASATGHRSGGANANASSAYQAAVARSNSSAATTTVPSGTNSLRRTGRNTHR